MRRTRLSFRLLTVLFLFSTILFAAPNISAQNCISAPSGLVAWWTGDGSTSDSSGNANNGTLQNGATFATGKAGQAFSFNGDHQYVTIPDSPSLNQSQEMTVEAWVRPAEMPSGAWMSVITKDNPDSGPYHLVILPDGEVVWQVFISSWTEIHSGTDRISPGTFSHIAGSYNASTGAFCVYVNGHPTCTQLSGPMRTTSNAIKIGGDLFNSLFFKGEIDEVSIYNRALSASEIQAIFNAGSAGKCKTAAPQQRPLIFIPGNPGSRLDELLSNGPNINIWPGPGGVDTYNFITELTLDPSKGSRRFNVTDVIRTGPSGDDQYGQLLNTLTSKGGYVEYRTDGLPDRRNTACDTSQTNATLFVFPYDWRQSITKNADNSTLSNVQLLREYIQCIQKIHPGTTVDILTHSTGGLLARRYIIDHSTDSQVNKLVTIAAPFLGAPKTIDVLETGKFIEYAGKWWLLGVDEALVNSRFKGLARYFPGVHELLPSRKYFELSVLPPYNLNGKDLNYNDFAFQLNKQLDPSAPGTNNSNFHDTPLQDDWTDAQNPANTGVKYFHIYGLNPWKNTIGRVKDKIDTDCTIGGCTISRNFSYEYVNGDGTVPVISAARRAQGLSLNAPGALVFRPPAVFPGDFVEHTGLVRNSKVQNGVLCILAAQTDQQAQGCINQVTQASSPQLASALLGQKGGMVNASAEEEPSAQPAFYLSVRGTDQITIKDDSGNSVTPFPSTQTTGTGLPSVTINPAGPKSTQFVIPTDQSYTVIFRTGGDPLSLELTLSGDSTTSAIRYKDLNLPPNIPTKLRLSPQGAEQLQADKDGDGVFESIVQSTVSVSGTAAQDGTAPDVTVTGTPQGGKVTVNISATDAESGVKIINYSLDGAHFQPYTGPLSIDPIQNPVVYTFADDNVANRSGLLVYYPSVSSNPIDNAQYFVRQHYLDFLNRDPDTSGLAFWTNGITSCGADAQCAEVKRINTSAAFFLSIEFQGTGNLVYKMYKAGFGNLPNKPVAVQRANFIADTRQIQSTPNQIIVGQGDWQNQLEANKQAFALAFIQRPVFQTAHGGQDANTYVNSLFADAGVSPTGAESAAAVTAFGAGGDAGRAAALRSVAESSSVSAAVSNESFVLMQYFGYLQRDPDAAPDSNFDGYNFWLGKLNQFNGNFVQAEMVKAFISSDEYHKRFVQ